MGGRVVSGVMLAIALSTPVDAQTIADERSRRQAIEFYRMGVEFMASERFDQAAESFTKAVKEDPLLTVAHYQLGQAYMNLRRYTSAVLAYKGCLQAMEALHHLEESNKFEVDKQRENTIREIRSEVNNPNLKIDPLKRTVLEQRLTELEHERAPYTGPFRPPGFVLLALGSAHFRNGDRDTAAAEWLAAIEANPKLGEAHNNLAVIYISSGRKAEAEAAVKAAETAGFASTSAQRRHKDAEAVGTRFVVRPTCQSARCSFR
jgi:tetratricopeptide (TPR) repeat protein